MALQPGDSIPRLFPRQSSMEACYRLLSHEKVTPEAVQLHHWGLTRQALSESPRPVLLINDQSMLIWKARQPITGLGPVSSSTSTNQGFLLHSTLAVELHENDDDSARAPAKVLGLAYQKPLVRPLETEQGKKARNDLYKTRGHGRSRAETLHEDRALESDLWLEPLRQMGSVPAGRRYIVVCDREGDFYELLRECQTGGYEFCIRAVHDRRLVEEQEKLLEKARRQPVLGTLRLELRARPGKAARQVVLSLSMLSDVQIRAPRRPGYGEGTLEPASLSVVHAFEQEPPEGEEALEWFLLVPTAQPSFEQALFWVRVYKMRWIIEEFHKALKTGLGAEDLQLESGKGLMTAVAIMSIVALRLLQLRDMARVTPLAPAKATGLGTEELEVLGKYLNRKLKTVNDVILAVGNLGGHLNRKSDGLPGWMTLWRGMFKLESLVEGYRLAKPKRRYH